MKLLTTVLFCLLTAPCFADCPVPATPPTAPADWSAALVTLVGILGAVWHGYTQMKNKKTQTALVQGVETAREIIYQTPNGAQLDARYVAWLAQHHEELGVAKDITKVVADVDPTTAERVAMTITAATQARPTSAP